MSHFAKINNNNIVTEIVVAEQDFINSVKVGDSFLWVQTSYNDNIRRQYAGIGYTYDPEADIFVSPSPFPSWVKVVNEHVDWEPPTPRPDDGKFYMWEEILTTWLEDVDPG